MGERGVWLVPDPCGLFCSSVAWFLIFFADYVTCVGIVWPWLEQTRLLHIAVLNFWAGMAIVSQLVCMLTDPGAIAKPTPDSENKELESQDNSGMRRCLKCGGIKPFRAHHCSVCQRCIMLMDHHCPWVNNCVGMYNQKHFLLFLLYVLFMSIHVMILLIARVVSCASFDYTHKRDYWRARRRNPSPFQSPSVIDGMFSQCEVAPAFLLLYVIVFFEAIVFGLFTLVMFCDQLSAVFSNATGIDQLQNTAGPQRSTCEALRQVFGTPLSIYWFLPTAVHFSFKKGGEDEREMIPWMSDVPWEQLETPPKEFFRSRSPLLACRHHDHSCPSSHLHPPSSPTSHPAAAADHSHAHTHTHGRQHHGNASCGHGHGWRGARRVLRMVVRTVGWPCYRTKRKERHPHLAPTAVKA